MKFRVTKNSPKLLKEALTRRSLGNAIDVIEEILNNIDMYDVSDEEVKILDAAYSILFDMGPGLKENLEVFIDEGYNEEEDWDDEFDESLEEAKEVNLSDKSNSISGLLLAGKDKIDSAASQSELVKICSDLLSEKGGAKAQQFLGVLKSKKGHYNALKYVYDFILAGEGMRSPDSQRKSKSVQRREALQQGKSLFESNGVTEDDLIKQGFERVSGRRGYDFYRKLVDGKGKWYASKDGEVMPITYMQARGYEPIDSDEAMGMKLGGILLPH